MGLDADALVGVPHSELYDRTLKTMAAKFGDAHACKDAKVTADIAAPLVDAFDACVTGAGTASVASSAAAMYFASEACVPRLYRAVNAAVRAIDPALTDDDLAFFALHIDMVRHGIVLTPLVK